MQKLGTRPRSFISGNICFEFSVQCLQELSNICIEKVWKRTGAMLVKKIELLKSNIFCYSIVIMPRPTQKTMTNVTFVAECSPCWVSDIVTFIISYFVDVMHFQLACSALFFTNPDEKVWRLWNHVLGGRGESRHCKETIFHLANSAHRSCEIW